MPSRPSARYIDTGGGLTMPVKIMIGVGGGAVAMLLIVIVVSSFLSSSEDNGVTTRQPTQGDGAGSKPPSTVAEPAAESMLAKTADLLSGLVKGKPKVYATPQEVFDAYWQARQDEDLKALMGTVSPELREQALIRVIKLVALLRATNPDIAAGLEKYGVDFENVSKMPAESELRELAAQVDDPAAFMDAANRCLAEAGRAQAEEFMEYARKARNNANRQPAAPKARRRLTAEERAQAKKMQEQLEASPKLTDLVITGDTAAGTVIHEGDLFKFSSKMSFVKIGESWYVAQVQM
jgi:hypothetical protein